MKIILHPRTYGITYPMRRGQNGYFDVSYDALTQIRSNLKNLLSTRKGERYDQEFGTDLYRLAFEPHTDDSIQQQATDYIETAINRWMPYITIEKLDFSKNTDTTKDQNKLLMSLTYSINDGIASDTLDLSFNFDTQFPKVPVVNG